MYHFKKLMLAVLLCNNISGIAFRQYSASLHNVGSTYVVYMTQDKVSFILFTGKLYWIQSSVDPVIFPAFSLWC